MRQTRIFWLCCLFCFCCAPLLRADNIPDPDIQVDDPTCTETSPCQSVSAGVPFSFSSGPNGGTAPGTNNFIVSGNTPFSELDIETVGSFSVGCFSNVYGSCTVRNLGGVTDIFLQGCFDDRGCGLPVGTPFSINLDNVLRDQAGNPICDPTTGVCQTGQAGVGGWGSNHAFEAIGGNNLTLLNTPFLTAPEPSSLFLLCSGGAAVALRRKLVRR